MSTASTSTKPSTATKPAATPTPTPAAKSKPAAKPKSKPATTKPAATKTAPRYPEWVPAAVKRSRVLSGAKPGPDGKPLGPNTLSYPGPKQHLGIRAAVTKQIEGPVTADAVLKLTGVKSIKALREIAEWTAPKTEMTPLRPLGRTTDDGTGWSTGRYLASALVAWIEELRAAEKASS